MSAFQFMTKSDLTLLLGRKAKSATELYAGLREVPAMSVYYHTHRFLQQHHYLSPEPPNDFAYWVTNVLNDDILGERLASIDIMQFVSIEEIRERFLSLLEEYLGTAERKIDCPRGVDTIYYHMFDARMRPELGNNDFSIWIRDSGYPELAKEIQALDPYSYTLEGLRKAVTRLIEDYASD
jgi:hypothetical protein